MSRDEKESKLVPLTIAAENEGVRRQLLGRLIRRGELPAYRSKFDRRLTLVNPDDVKALRRALPSRRMQPVM